MTSSTSSSAASTSAEQLSALADGQLQGPALSQALQACDQDSAMLQAWRDYHLIGEVLRGVPVQTPADEAQFLARLRPALQVQPRPELPTPPAPWPPEFPRRQSANQPRFHWRWVAAVVLVVGLAWTLGTEWSSQEASLAASESPLLVTGPQGVMIRDAALEDLMDAHRQQGGGSTLPMPSGFLRNATFDTVLPPSSRAGSR